jgi:hypothetical protein
MTHDEHEARQAAVSKALSEPLHVTNWRPLLAPEDVARLIDTAAALRAAEVDNERLRVALDELLADYLTHMQENAYTEMARNALDAARKDGTC